MPARMTLPLGRFSFFARRQVLGFQQLKLQRHRQAVFGPAGAKAHQALAAFDRRAADQRLEAVEIRQIAASASSVQRSQSS
jgi:hypothetical protein